MDLQCHIVAVVVVDVKQCQIIQPLSSKAVSASGGCSTGYESPSSPDRFLVVSPKYSKTNYIYMRKYLIMNNRTTRLLEARQEC
jgi:hypothetical protein